MNKCPLEAISSRAKMFNVLRFSLTFVMVACLISILAMPAKAFSQYMRWDFENNCNSWSGVPNNSFVHASYSNGRCGENTTSQYVVGNYSLYFKADGSLGGDAWYEKVSNGTISTYNWRFFLWIRMESASIMGSYTGLGCGLMRGTPEMYWEVGFEPEGSGFRAGFYVGSDLWLGTELFVYSGSPTVFSMNTWYAFQLRHDYSQNQTTLYYSTDGEQWTQEIQGEYYQSIYPNSFIMQHQENCHIYYGYTDYWVVTDSSMYPPSAPEPPQDFVGDYFGLGIFLGGIGLMVFSPSWVAWKIKKSGVTDDTVQRLGYALILFLIGFGLFINYIYGAT